MSGFVAASALSPRLFHGLADDVDRHLRIDGTAVVVDISGFTTLSEQLAAAGREGTEQLIATLSRIFTVLLPVTDDGGDVIKFAGDALFILFAGDQHARHAVHAAWNMNRVLTAIGDIHLPAARARLRMSVGVHSGTFEVILTGDTNISAVLTGRDTSRVLQLQDAASAGRILVSAETAAELPAKQVSADPDHPGAYRLLRAGAIATASLMALSAGRTEAADRFQPRAFAERPDLLGAEPDHRWAAISFIQVTGVPDEPTADDVDRMKRLTQAVEEAAADTGVTLLDVDPVVGGYRYFLTAGAPTTVEDPEGRLLTAVQRVVSSDSGYSLRAGVTSGRVFAGFVGAMYRQTYTVMGDETNLAARLTARAEPGTVLVTHAALERAAVSFESEDRGEITVKGKSHAIPVAIVTSAGSRPETGPGEAPFRGRRDEIAQVVALREAAESGLGGVLTITGGAGTGKSRLVDEALSDSPLRVLRVSGDRFGIGAPYLGLQTLLRPLLGIAPDASSEAAGVHLTNAVGGLRRTLLPWLPLLAPAVGAEVASTPAVNDLDDAHILERTYATLAKLIDDLLPEPTCLVIDDAQWLDAASAEALSAVFGDDIPHAVYVLRRHDGTGLAALGTELELPGLDDAAAEDLIEAVVGRHLLPNDLEPLVSRAQGNPLYLIELAAGLSAGSDALGIEQLVGERIDALTEKDRAIVRRAAVLGWGVPVGLFVRCVGPAELAEADGISGFLETLEETIRFRSGLFRDVAYEQLNYQTRRELHRAVAAALVADPTLVGTAADAMLAVHYEAAGDWEKALAAAARTGAAAEEAHAIEDAVRAYRTAVAAGGRVRPVPEGLPDLWESLGRVCIASGRATEALDAYAQALKLTKDAAFRARLDRETAYALNVLGRPDEAARSLRSARRGAAAAGEAGTGILASVAVTEAGLRLRQGRWADAKRLAAEAIALLDGKTTSADDTGVLADALRYHDIAAGELEGDAAMVNLERALELYDEVNDELSRSKVLNVLGARAYYRGEWSEAASLYGQAQVAAESAGDIVGSAIESCNAAEILIDQGRVDEARPILRTALRIFAGSDNPYLTAYVTAFSGRAHLRSGDPETARGEFHQAAETFTALAETEAVVDARVRGIEADLDLGDRAAASSVIVELLEGDALHGPLRGQLLRHAARLATLEDDEDRAVEYAEAAVEASEGSRFDRALALARLADADVRPDLLVEARAELAELEVADIDRLLSDRRTGATLSGGAAAPASDATD
ncbi:adenylate/guanylate cyclase domain-containing protein [Microbacterium sp. P5_E9]